MMKRRGLGRNLDVLLSQKTSIATELDSVPVETLRHLAIESLERSPYQPRNDFLSDTLQELAESIKRQGVLQPIIVREVAGHRYEIIAGERRWRAAQLAGLKNIPAVIKTVSDEAALAIALIENIQRQDLNSIEEAVALQRLIDEFNLTHEQAAQAVGRSRVAVTNLLRLLILQPEVKALLENKQLEMGHARALLALTGAQQLQVAHAIVEKKLSVRESEALIRRLKTSAVSSNTLKVLSPDIQHLQRTLSDKLGVAVQLKQNGKGRGRIIIHYNNADELEGILEKVQA